MDAIAGKNVTLETLQGKMDYLIIIWNFNNGREQVNVVTQNRNGLIVNAPYKGRVSVNVTSGALTLTDLRLGDSGDYSISVVRETGTKTAEIKLRVLSESRRHTRDAPAWLYSKGSI